MRDRMPPCCEETAFELEREIESAAKDERERIVKLIREKAESRDYATCCSWKALATELEREQS